ncbi:hypothetical protein B1H18_10845 [Streptomyces tsukubensis]|uniref:HTH marR-type domain-containing protein n=1 Tax=Streptomyces tsukubensis TaxID=83656 RepID=A0A1V4AAW4_9ACTN|nr:hypothetical protein B1H18_10845 [Streptomyces tsukubensis]
MDELQASLASLAYLMSGSRTHTRLRSEADVTVDRAALSLLRELAGASAPLRMGELAGLLHVKAPHVTREINRLEARGLVETDRDPGDQRVRRATVTENGREAVARAGATNRQWLAGAVDGFSPEELRTTAAVITRIVGTYRAYD